MKYSFHEDAERDFFAAIEYYEKCQSGLGLEFSEEIHAAIERIREHPNAWTAVDSKTRRCLTNRFPYGILYRVVESHIRIMAVMHLHRKPDYWTNRA
uniref:ParE toxin of type II toxin-antitoxin system, parDE n=1 Tax=Candidatus Kentrum sp. UNK TaxID=2126344 RepID=A0A451AVU5_9GAMM|nr:MAG: ParE toxin of type II toxin-antitoxin system, parDE [Candidatus Kentron sp. UNK]VFK70163.1 MAG: ParE toxin of type II toxin-antitoxin system, parDE [Candidatus Kentron sp. UNK]